MRCSGFRAALLRTTRRGAVIKLSGRLTAAASGRNGLNIIFDAEDEALWHERVRQAMAYRAETEAALRGRMYVQAIDGSCIAPMDQDQMDRILGLVAGSFPLTSLHLVEQCTREVEELYYFSLKRAQHWRELAGSEEQRRAEVLGLPPPPSSLFAFSTALPATGVGEPRASLLCGTIDTPSPNFRVSREFIAENLFQTHALLRDTVYAVHTQWNEYNGELLCITQWDRRETPMELRNFEELQAHRGFSVSEKLQSEWSINIRCTIQNNLDLHFKFYEDNLERYTASRMCRLVNLVNVMMTSQLRGLLLTSLQEFAAFIHRYRVEPRVDDTPMDELQEDLEESEHWRRRQEEWEEKQRAAMAEAERIRNVGGGGGRSRQQKNVLPPLEEKKEVPYVWRLGTFRNHLRYTKRVVEMTMNPKGLRPLFVLNLVEDAGRVVFSPSLEDVSRKVKAVFEGCFEYTDKIHGMGDQLFPLLPLQPRMLRPLDASDPEVCEARSMVEKALSDNVEAPLQLQQMYQTFGYILQQDTQALVKEVNALQLTLLDFDWIFERLSRDRERITRRTPNHVKYEMFLIDCKGIKASLIAKSTELQNALMKALAERMRDTCSAMISEYDTMSARMAGEPQSPEELQDVRDFLDGIPARQEQLNATFVDSHRGR
ncbi:dynein heavy chain [Trypanosoma rangeli SC58]|uniref:Dynein heavy chain n=1 Tax=Trypanosoma rangeli SC58 TaxID=429131 RepID=A0A061J6Q9_TRYRA|nr:dynein heavy chain [Trypanosoma rangeli SC58]